MELPSVDGYSSLEKLGEGWACCCWWFRHSAFGEVFRAVENKSRDFVALKRIKIMVNSSQLQSENALLKECNSKYIVRYYGIVSNRNENWVCQLGGCWWNRLWWSTATVDLYTHSLEVEIGWMRVNCARLRAAVCLDSFTFTTLRSFTEYGIEEWIKR